LLLLDNNLDSHNTMIWSLLIEGDWCH